MVTRISARLHHGKFQDYIMGYKGTKVTYCVYCTVIGKSKDTLREGARLHHGQVQAYILGRCKVTLQEAVRLL